MTGTSTRAVRRPRVMCYDDATARTFEPFALTRPWCEMRVGALLVRERWSRAFGADASHFIGDPALRLFSEPESTRAARGVLRAGTVVVNSRFAVALAPIGGAASSASSSAAGATATVYRAHDHIAALRLPVDVPVAELADGTLSLDALARTLRMRARGVHVDGFWCDDVWDPVRYLDTALTDDLPRLAAWWGCAPLTELRASGPGPLVLGGFPVWIERGATVEPLSVFDTTRGPVLVRSGATVRAFTRINGPCYIGRHTQVMGDAVGGSAIGDHCKVHGEVSASIFMGYANKGHHGFVGHSMLGRWVNLGAGTTTSNLKNTYGTVALWTPTGVRNTGLQFLGTLFGDHVKTGIGLHLTTGCVLGAGANVVERMPPKVVPPFAWGSGVPYATYAPDKFVETAERVMKRRAQTLDANGVRYLRAAFARRWSVE